jgi:glycosyltransferase involved in cell wall biosynthesis
MKQPLISVILPSYNHAVYLKERIESVLNQNYPNFEVIIMDDCSTDNSREIISQYKDNEHISQIIFNEQNTGNTFIQWERGVKLSKGEYIWIAESDDVAEPAFLSTLASELDKHPQAVLAYSYSMIIDFASYVIYKDDSLVGTADQVKVYDGMTYARHFMMTDNCIYNASMVLFRKEIFDKISPKYKKYRCCGDWLFWACACKLGDVIEVRIPLNRFRQHLNKVTSRTSADGSAWMDMAGVQSDLRDEIKLSNIERRSLRVIWNRKITNSAFIEDPQVIIDKFPRIFKMTPFDYLAYKLAKKKGFIKRRTRCILGFFNVPFKDAE